MANFDRDAISSTAALDKPVTSPRRRTGAVVCGVLLFIALWVVAMNLIMWVMPDNFSRDKSAVGLWCMLSWVAGAALYTLAREVAKWIASDFAPRILTSVIMGLLFVVLAIEIVSTISLSNPNMKNAGFLFCLMFGSAIIGVFCGTTWFPKQTVAKA